MKKPALSPWDPRFKIVTLFLYNILVFSLKGFVSLGLLFALLTVLWIFSPFKLPSIKAYARFFLPLLMFLLLIQIVFIPGENYLIEYKNIRLITREGALVGLLLGLRLLILTMLMPTFFLTTPLNNMILGLAGLGIPYKTAYLITTALNIIPVLKEDIITIITSQKLRGFAVFEKGRLFEKMKAYPVLVVPLIVGSVRRAQTMGVAMETRAYGISRHRTYRHRLKLTLRDIIKTLLLISLGCFLFLLDRRYPL